MTDPFEALRLGPTPAQPDPGFATSLRERLDRLVLFPEEPMSVTSDSSTTTSSSRNGVRQGDISYITLRVPDLEHTAAFFGRVLGWEYAPGRSADGRQVERTAPMIGLWGGDLPDTDTGYGAMLAVRVDDVAAAAERVRAAGGTANDPEPRPYGLESTGRDDQGMPFWLHELADGPGGAPAPNGAASGDVSYLTVIVADVARFRRFWATVLEQPQPFDGTAPMVGVHVPMPQHPEPAVVLAFQVDDIAAAVEQVRAGGGAAGEVEQRPYALEALCDDGRGLPFYLHQF
jgi:predicted enzyme related to lactoylglutathione lyase